MTITQSIRSCRASTDTSTNESANKIPPPHNHGVLLGVDTMYRPDRTGAHRSQFETNKKIILATQELCAICGQPVDKSLKSPDPMSASIDHIIPVFKGGHPSDLSNLQLSHRACNRAKGIKLVADVPKKNNDPNRELPHSVNWRTA